MKKSEWNDREMEEMIRQLPTIKDERHPSYIYAQVRKKNKAWTGMRKYVPALAALAALFIVVLLTPALMSQLSSEDSAMEGAYSTDSSGGEAKTAKDSPASDSDPGIAQNSAQDPKEESQLKMAEGNNENNESMMVPATESQHDRLSVYEEDIDNKDFYSYGLVSGDAIPVPVTVISTAVKDQTDWVGQHESISNRLPETEWGFQDYFPIKGDLTLSENKESVVLTLEDNHPYSGSSAIESNFYQSLLYSFEDKNVKEIILQNKDGSTPEFSHYGPLASIPLNQVLHQAYYSYSPDGQGRYLVPGSISRNNVKQSIEAMKEVPSDLYKSVIPDSISMEVTESEKMVFVKFNEKVNLDAMEFQSAQEFIEGILLTAKSSGYEKVQFQNIEQEEWNGFTFTEPLETPLSPNKKSLDE
ncbi:hypothetical protein [Bacillus sp. Marseille-Q1617]|uniref:hypothetical protein n=1 Tax=Bacillus sp. Marseille-Q1617 TaxID=2736887 RepID=UPI0015888137|nr:hypothetical protein [Bacillus sp. Marseille-Q1617]